MKVQAHFLAESANFASDGTFTVFKGGITDLNSSTWPAMAKLTIVTRLELTPEEASDLIELRLRLSHDGTEMGTVSQPLAVKVVDANKPIYVNSIANLNLLAPAPGRITIEASINDIGLPLIYLWGIHQG